MSPDEVPRTGERVGEEDVDEVFTFKRREREVPSRELEDVLTGFALRDARARFEGRGSEGDVEMCGEAMVDDGDESDSESEDRGCEEEEGEDEENPDMEEEFKSEAEEEFVPVVSLDDDQSAEILRPNIRHTLSKLDEILTALHHARVSCRRYSSPTEADGLDDLQEASDQQPPEKKPVGRPRKFQNLTHRSRNPAQGLNVEDNAVDDLRRSKSTNRGRPPKQYPRLEGESAQEYHVRIARLQKKPLPPFAPPLPVKEPELEDEKPVKKEAAPRSKKDVEDLAHRRASKLELRDWSEVLGTAALVGFSPAVIARATQRCANIFGEGMVLKSIPEVPFGDDPSSFDTIYQAEEIPDHTSQIPEEESQPPSVYGGMYTCPLEDCTASFETKRQVNRHMKRRHGMGDEEIEKYDVPSDLEMEGAVHVDRFLRPSRRYVRGPDKRKRKRRGTGEGEGGRGEAEDEDEEVGSGLDGEGTVNLSSSPREPLRRNLER
ncbi:hypothetical protein M7I_2172 [Glarea lozoyensis 74030]|uniref:C2H2-type domain-containing protein n=1 Tax=Glarea lozoyensis (strain ATCC 74030 / MF5533) TaxID=1104152 RepID=H0EI26_GLAL7|nr:hypothetical protein M7I_2172 [Glarea lozoyensis 74030]